MAIIIPTNLNNFLAIVSISKVHILLPLFTGLNGLAASLLCKAELSFLSGA